MERCSARVIVWLAALLLLGAFPVIASDWWSFQPVKKVSVPKKVHPIDYFISQKLASQNLTLSPEADRRTQIRRLYLVMLGVPPEPATVSAYLADDSLDAWEKRVDQVLADSRYGERWAQHWLDIIRWAETVGFETNAPRPNAWPFRDWVIESLNADKPYDRFVFEQIAGDTLEQDRALGFLVAGPANLPGQIGRDEEAMRTARQDELDEVIRTVGQSMLGLTIGCARCHDHKFDPISERDYYAMQAVFAGLRYGDRRWRGEENEKWTAQMPVAQKKVNDLVAQLGSLQNNHNLEMPVQDRELVAGRPVTTSAVRMEIRATDNGREASLYEFEAWSMPVDSSESRNVALASAGARVSASGFQLANQTRHFDNLIDGSVDSRQSFPWVNDKRGTAWFEIEFAETETLERILFQKGNSTPADYTLFYRGKAGEWQKLSDSGRKMLRLSDVRSTDKVSFDGVTDAEAKVIVETNANLRKARAELGRLSAGPQVYAASFTDPEKTYVLKRGDAMQRGDEIAPAIPVVLGDLHLQADTPDIERRVAFAKHLISGKHPLTARVIANRVWQYHFGTGIVETSSDFGEMGQQPSHPELLDWLAADLVEQGWSLKKLHRRILTSRTFRQGNEPEQKALAVDADSRLLWRFPPRRVEAEVIRDSILSVSGKLNPRAGGKGFDFFKQQGGLSDYQAHETFNEDGWRRMVYARKIRMQSVNIFGSFDCPDAGQMKPQRTRSITPLQALSLMNSPFVNRQAGFFAKRLQDQFADAEEQIAAAFELAFARLPSGEEKQKLVELAETHGLEQVCRVILNTSEFVTIP